VNAPARAAGTILIADDNRVNRLLLARGLEQEGHTIVFAEHGNEALDLLGRQPFDLVLLDVLMPELDGASEELVDRIELEYRPLEEALSAVRSESPA